MSAQRISWEPVGSPEAWDALVRTADDRNIFQSAGWGEYRRFAAWRPRRLVARDVQGRVAMLAQLLTRSAPGRARLSWIPGGPLIGFEGHETRRVSASLAALVKLLAGEGRGYLRADPLVPHDHSLDYSFSQILHRTLFPLNSGFSVRHDLTRSADEIRQAMTTHHRYYADRALAAGLRCAPDGSARVQDLVALHEEMRAGKRSAELAPFTAEQLVAMRAALGEGALVYTAHLGDEPVCTWLVSVFGDRAFLLHAASGSAGRQIGASYGLAYRLLLHLKERGITELDLGGIDPRARHAGVSFFKQGFGGEVVQYLGEWEWSNSRILRVVVNLAARRRSDVA